MCRCVNRHSVNQREPNQYEAGHVSETGIDEVVGRIALFEGRDVDVSPLSGGFTNGVFLVRAGDERFAVRVPGPASELLGLDREAERSNAGAAATTGVSPRILEYLEDLDVMVLEFIEGAIPTMDQLQAPEQVRRMCGSIRRLHDGPRFSNDFDMFGRAKGWLRACDEHAFPTPDRIHDRMDALEDVVFALAKDEPATVPCHNDLAPYNFIDDGQQLWIIDFEYSGNNDPCYDLGMIAGEAELDDDLRAVLCASYFGEVTPRLLARMKLQATIANAGWSLYCAIQARALSDPGFWEGSVAYWTEVLKVMDSRELPHLVRAGTG